MSWLISWLFSVITKTILAFLLILLIPACLTKRYVNKNDEYKSESRHVGVVIGDKYGYIKNRVYFLNGITDLINHFRENDIPYRVYKGISGEDFKKIVNDEKVESLFIFGHGCRHGFTLGKNDGVYYCELRNAPKKKFIAQLHCNHGSGKSLGEYIAKDYFAPNKKMCFWENRKYIKERCENNLKFKDLFFN